ncbi:MAG: MotA/TolQ/ExbB proton channel family protein [Pacificimonas sp.]
MRFDTLSAKASVAAGALLVAAPVLAQEEEVAHSGGFGIREALIAGGPVTWFLMAVLIIMSLGTWYILFTKWWDQRKIMNEAKEVDKKFWAAPSLKEGAAKLPKDSPYRMIVEDGMRAADHHEGRLTDKIDQHEWVTMSLDRSQAAISSKLAKGLSFLASTGSTSPFVGLLGTVIGIYRALIGIGLSGQASIDKVAGPVGEALIMTAVGLFVAVPAVLAYNWLLGRNRDVLKHIGIFADDVHGFLVSGARVAPATAAVAAKPAAARTVPGQATTTPPKK